ncbi:MAG TPA: protein kinase [Solirubrobacteraceae bacterium]
MSADESTRRQVPATIGKYRVTDRIGRGGMGMIFKAHDPVLDRLVALKVISPEVEVTDELRARFFREAKACAKLNHPNIVTVYDMGEDESRLFIVMELLEGQELRQLIKANPALSVEDKISVMLEVCSGLHYAHQKGIIHRDMKPGNIFLQKNGHVKILDFGIAHIATTEAGLTRSGLIMGTLRYISPEQVRGRVDHRSDMFSIGSVFYELLTSRPPFMGDDAMQVLEQLRTEDPPPPGEIDPTIPPELTAIVQRAMRKDPAERFRDLEEMRTELAGVHGRLLEERQRVLTRVHQQRERLARLQAALAERLGTPDDDTPIPSVAERHGLIAAQTVERQLAGRIEALEGKIARADALAPAFQRAHELLDIGGIEDAAEQFESIVAEMPDHQRARDDLDRARAQAGAQRQRQLAADLLARARAALADQRYALCLEVLKQTADLSLPEGASEEIAGLRQTALARQESLRHARTDAETARASLSTARGEAQTEDAAQHAEALWTEAEAAAATAEAALRREAYVDAKQGFATALALYRRATEAARQGRDEERHAATRARDTATQGQRQAQGVGASQYARELWEAAEARFVEAQAAFAQKPSAAAGAAFTEAAALYRRAEDTAREMRDREHRRADAARERVAEGRRSAESMDAEHRAPAVWQQAVAKSTEGEAALLRQQYGRAADAFEAALALYHQAQTQVRELQRRLREEARAKQVEVVERRRAAVAVEAASHATADWNEAEARAGTGEAALAGEAWEDASRAFDAAVALYRRAEERSREAVHARADVEKAVEAVEAARRGAAGAEASRYAPELWKEAERTEARAVAALSQQQFAAARPLFDEAGQLYANARAAGIAASAKTKVEALHTPTFGDAPTILIRPPETVQAPTPVAPASAEPTRVTPVRPPAVPTSIASPTASPAQMRASDAPGRPATVVGGPRTRFAVIGAGVAIAAIAAGMFWWRADAPQAPAVTPPVAVPSTAAPVGAPPAPRQEPPTATADKPKTDEAAPQTVPPRRPTAEKSDRVATTPPPPARTPPVRPRPAVQPAPGTPLPAASIRASVEQRLRGAKLLRTPNSDDPGVAVEDVAADGTVKLVGVLRDAAARQAAADLVRTVAGVTAVDVRRVTVQKGWVSQ